MCNKVMGKVSIVIPVCNVEKYLRECLDSVLAQTLQDIEVICVDDGSTDSSGRILDEYAALDQRIHVIHKRNEGYGKAMNVGISAATADYVGIVESDDLIVPQMYQCLYDVAKTQNVDVVKADHYEFYQDTEGAYIEEYVPLTMEEKYFCLYNTPISVREHEEAMYFSKFTWSGIYNRDFLLREHIWHNETPGASYQDNGFWFQTMVKSRKIYLLREAFYKYRIDNTNSSTNSKGKVFAVCDEYEFIHDILDRMGEKGSPFYKWARLRKIIDCLNNIHRVSEENKVALAKRVKEEFWEGVRLGEVDLNLYTDWEKIKILEIIVDPEKYVEHEKARRDRIEYIVKDFDTIVLYGAGKIGRQTLNVLKEGRVNTKIKYFAVTDTEGNEKDVLGIPVRNISDLQEYKEDALIIMSVGKQYLAEIQERLYGMGFQHCVYYNELI